MVPLTWMSKLTDWWTPPKFQKVNCDEDDLIKDIANNFSAEEKTSPPIRKSLASIINDEMFNPVSSNIRKTP